MSTQRWLRKRVIRRRALLAGAAAFAVARPSDARAQATLEARSASGPWPLVIAHRAKVGGVPSNALAGIAHAIEGGIDMVEVDVQVTADGQHILMHDPVLSTSTNVREVFPTGAPSLASDDPQASQYRVADFTLDDIGRLRLRDPRGGDHPVPTLDAALDLAAGKVRMILDLKLWQTETLLPLLARHATDHPLLFTTGSERQLRETAEASGLGVFASLGDLMSVARGIDRARDRYGSRLRMVSIAPRQFSQEVRAKASAQDLSICINGCALDDALVLRKDAGPWLEVLQSGADAVLTRRPTEVMALRAGAAR
jgi:hypothetical protein